MRRASFISKQLSRSESEDHLDMNGNVNNECDHLLSLPSSNHEEGQLLATSKSLSSFWSSKSTTGMTSRPSFISLMLIASDAELSRLPRLPAPLQVESDTYQKCGWDDEPKVCSHLPILHPPSDSDDEGGDTGVLQTIIQLPERIRKISADKHRFNVYALPDQDRQQLKNLYVF